MNARNNRLMHSLHEIYRRLYAASEPKGEWDSMVASGEVKQEDFFLQYYLSTEDQDEIFKQFFKENKTRRDERLILSNSIILGASPTNSREVMLKERGL